MKKQAKAEDSKTKDKVKEEVKEEEVKNEEDMDKLYQGFEDETECQTR